MMQNEISITRYVTESPFRITMLMVAVAAATAGTVSLIIPTHLAVPAICMTAGLVTVAYGVIAKVSSVFHVLLVMDESEYTDSFVAREIVSSRFARILICCGVVACVAFVLAVHVM